jgi:hypothetical protein
MTEPAGLEGPLPSLFEDGLRLFAAALAIKGGKTRSPEAVSSACASLRCFLRILEAGAARGLPDPDGNLRRLRAQCAALLDPGQVPEDALAHTLEAVRLARDAAARVLVLMPPAHAGGSDE